MEPARSCESLSGTGNNKRPSRASGLLIFILFPLYTVATVIFVTSNLEEAIYLGDRIVLLGGNPTSVKAEYIPDMPRPRNYTSKEFLKLRNKIADNTDLAL